MSEGISTASGVLMGVLPYAIGIFALFLGIRIAKRVIKTVARG
jgi:TctA family transporter